MISYSLEKLIAEAAQAVRPARRMSVSQSAEAHRYINMPGAYVGPWKNSTTPYLVEPMDLLADLNFTGMVFVGPAQTGKSLALDTPIATPSGWTTMGAIKVGDFVFGSDGKPTEVVIANPVQMDRPCYRVVFDEGSEIVADADHKWSVEDIHRKDRRIATTRELAEQASNTQGRARFRIPIAPALETKDVDLFMDPYVLGVWLGDGSELYGYVSVGKADSDAMVAELEARGYRSTVYKPSALHRCFALGVRGPDGVFIDQYLSTMGLGGGKGKRIPAEYLRASEAQRRELFRGLCDTDGGTSGTHKRAVQFTSVDEALARQVAELGRSLGHKIRLKFKPGPGRGSWNVFFSVYSGSDAFSLPRKRESVREDSPARPGETSARFIREIVPVESVPVRCIGVAADDHLFLAGEGMIATHNTDMVLNWLQHSVMNDPADMMIVQTSRTTARDFSMRRIDRLHRNNPDMLERVAKDNTYDVDYGTGMLLTLSWPTVNELSGKPIPRLWLTDYDRMTMDVDGEGSPYDLARKRATTFKRHGMTVAESSPGFIVDNPRWVRRSKHEAEPTQGILALYNRGDRRRWYYRCVSCDQPFEPDFELLSYPDSEDKMESAENAKLCCPFCDARYSHDGDDGLPGKHELNQTGRWVQDGMTLMPDGSMRGVAPRSTIASFWLKGVAAAFSDWKTLVFNYLSAEEEYQNTQSEEALKSTVNTDQGKPYLPKSSVSNRVPEQLKSRAKPLGLREVPASVRFLIACIDVQKNRYVVQVHGIADNTDIYVIDRFDIKKSQRLDDDGERLWVNPGAHPEDWKLIVSEVMQKTYPLGDGSGRRMGIKQTVCDSGGREGVTANAYNFVRWLRYGDDMGSKAHEPDVKADEGDYEWSPELSGRFMLLKGASSPEAPRFAISYPDSQRKDRHAEARGEIPIGFLNTTTIKDALNNRLDREEPGGRIVFPDWLSDNFYIELTVEVRDPKKGWLNPKQYRNESWDLLAYCLTAFLLPSIHLEGIDFEEPPGWAAEWDRNDLIYDPKTAAKPFDAEQKQKYSLAKLAANLA